MFKGMSDLKSAMKEGENRGTDDPKNLTSIISVFQRPDNSGLWSYDWQCLSSPWMWHLCSYIKFIWIAKMILILSRLSMAFFLNPTDMHIPQSCYHCMESKLEDCASNQMMMMNCSNATFPNVGSGDCYTAVGWYMMNNTWHSTALRGCVNCSGNHKQQCQNT